MHEELPAVTTGSQILSLPKALLEADAPDVRVLINHIESIAGSMNTLPRNKGLAVSIERVRREVAEWTERLSADSRIAFERYVHSYPDREQYARKRLDDVMREYHRKVAKVFHQAENYCCDVYDSVDVKRFSRDLRSRLGIREQTEGTSTVVERYDVLKDDGDEFKYFKKPDLTLDVSHKTPTELFMNALSPATKARLLIDGARIDDPARREQFVRSVIEPAARDPGEHGLPNETIEHIVQAILATLHEMRTTRNPYMLKVGSRTLLGLLPEIPDISGDDPVAAFVAWRDGRKYNEEDPEESPTAAADGLTHNQCGDRRGRTLNGNLVVYMNDAIVEEIEAHEGLESQVGSFFAYDKAGKPAALHFYDKHELEETILCLPVNAGAVLHMQIRETDLFCRLYRNGEGELVIEDEQGQFPVALRNTDISGERILANPFEFFSARNMRLEMRDGTGL